MGTDADFLGFTVSDGRGEFTVVDRLTRHDGRLYGGAATAVSIAAAEERTGCPALWNTTQFASTAPSGTSIEVHTDVVAAGHRTNQVRVTATTDTGQIVFTSLGATGRLRPDASRDMFENRPLVTSPSDSRPWTGGVDHEPQPRPRPGFSRAIDMRRADALGHPEPESARTYLWVRPSNGTPVTRAVAGYLADRVPMSIARTFGVNRGGTSLDNTIRFGAFTQTEWILLDLRPQLVAGGYGHGVADLWTEDGHLLAVASQTVSMALDLPPAPVGTVR